MAGPGPVLYLDVDDEITSAAARVRAVEGTRVALVVPPGSRVATSRINFRLLARDAGVHGRRLAIIAPDAASRALAAAAGLEVFASVAEYETAMGGAPAAAGAAASPTPDAATAGQAGGGSAAPAAVAAAAAAAAAGSRAGSTSPASGSPSGSTPPAAGRRPEAAGAPPDAGTPAAPAAGETAATAPPAGDELRPRSAAASVGSVGRGSGRRVSGRAIVAVAAVAIVGLLVVGGVVGYLLLPSATIVVVPRVETVGPIEVTVTADPDATTVDAEAGVVPAERLPLDVQASGTYPATGERVVTTTAVGTVRFTNCDFLSAHQVQAGARVSTERGTAFTTDEAIVIPAADFKFPDKVTCANRDVGITAVKEGPDGNVPAGAITVVPGDVNPVAVRVTNRAPTTGGSRESFPQVTEADVTAAQADLDKQLDAAFAAEVADPDTAPAGSTLFPETAALGDPVPDGDPSALIGQEVAEFDLSATASGTVVAVDETPITAVAESRLGPEVQSGYELVDGSVETRIGDPVVEGETVVFPVTVTGLEVRQLDPAELEQLVLGLTPEEARQVLAPYGDAEITLTPDWATTIPTYAFRVDVSVAGGSTPSPSTSPKPTRSVGPTPASPAPSGS